MAFPLAAILAPAAISAGAGLLGKFLDKGPKETQASIEAGKKAESERALLDNRLRILNELEQNKGEFKTIMGKNGKPFIVRLPGAGGISNEKFTNKLRHLAGSIDFGQAKDIQLLQSIAGLSSPSSNTSGVAVQGAQQAQARSDQNAQGIASLIGDIGTGVAGHFLGPGGGGGGVTDVSSLVPGDIQAPNPTGPISIDDLIAGSQV